MEPKGKSKRTRRVILAVVAVVAVAAILWVVSQRPWEQLRQSGAQAANSESEQIVTAFLGDLSAGATASGWLLPQREAQLALGITGQVKEVYVEVGDEVRAGDVLIQLEAGSLERAVRSAEQTLVIQEASLTELRQGASDEEITAAKASVTQAEAGVLQAEASLAQAKANLAELRGEASEEEVATAEASVTQAEAGVLQAEASLAQAKANLAELRKGASEEEIAAAEASLDSAKASLLTAQAGLLSARSALSNAELARDSLSDADVTAEANLKSAQAGLSSAQAQLDSVLAGADAETIEQARLSWEQAKNSLWNAQLERDAVRGRPGTPGYVNDQMDAAVANAEIAVRVAEINYLQAQEGATAEVVAAAEASVAAAEAQVANAQAQLDDIDDQIAQAKASVTQAKASVTQAEASVLQAEAGVTQAEANLTMLLEGASEEAIAAAESQVAQAEAGVSQATAQVEQAEANLTMLVEGASEEQIAAAEASVAQAEAGVLQAEAAVTQAEANLASLLAGASEEQIARAEAQVAQARISLEDAQDNLTKATLKAPSDGVVTEVYVEVGEWATGLAAELIDTSSLEVVLDVDEIDIGSLAVGQQAIVTLETWPDEELAGELVSIAPKARSSAEIVTYQVHLSLDAGDLPVRSGMTANAELVTANREGVLLVPNRAITADRQAGKYYVNLVQGDTVVKTEVTIGLRDSTYTEITSGLAEGDRLVIGEVKEVLDFSQGPPEEIRRLNR